METEKISDPNPLGSPEELRLLLDEDCPDLWSKIVRQLPGKQLAKLLAKRDKPRKVRGRKRKERDYTTYDLEAIRKRLTVVNSLRRLALERNSRGEVIAGLDKEIETLLRCRKSLKRKRRQHNLRQESI